MIKVKAHGSLITALGKAEFEINEDGIKVKKILDIITSSSGYKPSPLLMLILVNGIEISALDQEDTVVKSGDKVVLIPIHGG
ncbi:MAG: MoaD/ThiS family protein [Candidatus Methylarchaceae archaeon HK02M2]|nr:MoaD/ThiS family protein [Candidatus Methylarchaceae archaeon HK02M2]